ncbi:hypothetical protein [Streptomyces sp. WM4235]|uniref:hypothetical protein n=1 Tax=Streptomyces sp. WM4235 TaxID=1415551 RepID=UPI000AAB0683|nr:hypothetical protein [Streptomyces sp. WM4235]
MNTQPPPPDPLLQPVRDPRAALEEHVLAERRATLVPAGAIDMVRAAFDAVNPLLHPPFAAEAPAADVGGAQPEGA